MTAVRAVAHSESWSLSRSIREYFFCCYERPTAADKMAAENHIPAGKGSMTSLNDIGDERLAADGASVHSAGTAASAASHGVDSNGMVTSTHDADADNFDITISGGNDVVAELAVHQSRRGSDSECSYASSGQSPLHLEDVTRLSTASIGSVGHNRTASMDRVPVGDDGSDRRTRSQCSSLDRSGVRDRSVNGSEKSPSLSVRFAKTDDDVDVAVEPNVDVQPNVDEGYNGGLPILQPPTTSSNCGSVRLAFRYESRRRRLTVEVREAIGLPDEDRGGSQLAEVHLVLLPTKRSRHKTHAKPGSNPTFNDSFQFRVTSDQLNSLSLRLRVYGGDRMRRERLIGEKLIELAAFGFNVSDVDQNQQQQQSLEHVFALDSRSNITLAGDTPLLGVPMTTYGSTSSLASSDGGGLDSFSSQQNNIPELMLGLAYNESTGRLSVEVMKGSNFKNPATSKPLDTLVKLELMAFTGKEMSHGKTTTRRNQPNPLYKETVVFQVPQTQLEDVTLMVSVLSLRGLQRRPELYGWFSLGRSNTSEDASSHWSTMVESSGHQISRWHALIEP